MRSARAATRASPSSGRGRPTRPRWSSSSWSSGGGPLPQRATETLIQASYDAWNRRDVERLRELYTADCVWDHSRIAGWPARGDASSAEVELEIAQIAEEREGRVARVVNYSDVAEARREAGIDG